MHQRQSHPVFAATRDDRPAGWSAPPEKLRKRGIDTLQRAWQKDYRGAAGGVFAPSVECLDKGGA